MLGGLPTPLDPFEARRLLFTLLLLEVWANATRVPADGRPDVRRDDPSIHRARRPLGSRQAVRPPRGC